MPDSAVFAILGWFCAGLCWSLPVSLFCAGFAMVSAGLCRFRFFVLVLCWSLLRPDCITDIFTYKRGVRSRPQGGRMVSGVYSLTDEMITTELDPKRYQ